jgi:hypothetical protein
MKNNSFTFAMIKLAFVKMRFVFLKVSSVIVNKITEINKIICNMSALTMTTEEPKYLLTNFLVLIKELSLRNVSYWEKDKILG